MSLEQLRPVTHREVNISGSAAGTPDSRKPLRTAAPTQFLGSGVYGYRPAKLRRGYDKWDYRGFAELTGEHTGGVRSSGAVVPNSSTTTVWLGPSVLAIFNNIAIEGGVQAPIYRDVSDSLYGRERIRFAINLSYLKILLTHQFSLKGTTMKKTFVATALALSTLTAHAEYEQVNLTVFGHGLCPLRSRHPRFHEGHPGSQHRGMWI